MPPELLEFANEKAPERYLEFTAKLIYDEARRHTAQGKYELAEETLAFMSQARPSDPQSPALLGDLYRARSIDNDQELAMQCYEGALQLDPRNAKAHRGLGLTFAKFEKPERAIRHLRLYLEYDPQAPDATYIRQYVEKLSKGQF